MDLSSQFTVVDHTVSVQLCISKLKQEARGFLNCFRKDRNLFNFFFMFWKKFQFLEVRYSNKAQNEILKGRENT